MRRPVVLSLFILLTLAGCGGRKPTSTPAPTPAPPTATSAPTATPQPTATPKPSPTPAPPPSLNVIDTAISAGNFETFVRLLEQADLADKLKAAGPYTLFAPTDAAFEAVSPATLADPDALYDLLLYHVAPGRFTFDDLSTLPIVESELGDPLEIGVDGAHMTINDASIVSADIAATNGVLHAIDRVLSPPGE